MINCPRGLKLTTLTLTVLAKSGLYNFLQACLSCNQTLRIQYRVHIYKVLPHSFSNIFSKWLYMCIHGSHMKRASFGIFGKSLAKIFILENVIQFTKSLTSCDKSLTTAGHLFCQRGINTSMNNCYKLRNRLPEFWILISLLGI